MKCVIIESALGNVWKDGAWVRVLPGSPEYEENVRYAKLAMRDSLLRGEAPYASHLLYAQPGIFDDANQTERDTGMHAGFAWSDLAHEAVVYLDRGITPGMLKGIERHRETGLPVRFRRLAGYDNATVSRLFVGDPWHVPPSGATLARLGTTEYRGPRYVGIDKPLVGITGLKGHGKDTVGKHLEDAHHWSREAWAGKLKAVARSLWDLHHSQVDGTIEQKETMDERWGVTPRHLLQALGTEVARHAHPETWIRFLLRQLAEFEASELAADQLLEGWAICDCRFPNEADAIRKHGGIVVRVVRPESGTGQFEDHASEIGVSAIKADYVILNDGSLDDLHATVDALLDVLVDRKIAAWERSFDG